MNEFAIVCEGVTDYQVLKNVLLGWFKGQDAEPFLKPYQPDPTAEGEAAWQKHGSWENVFRYLHEKKHRDALEYADYLVIQIDSDVSEHPNFGVSQQENGAPLDVHTIVERIVDRLRSIIGAADIAFYGDRIIFAICVREIECWLLPLWDPQKADKCEGCLDTLNRALRKKDERCISPDSKSPDLYARYSRDYRKRKVLLQDGIKNQSLEIFLKGLDRRNIALKAD